MEIDLAIAADLGTLQRLPKLIGDMQARELAYTGRDMKAPEAVDSGLVLQSFSDADTLINEARKVAVAIASKSPVAVRATKRAMLHSRDNGVPDSLRQMRELQGTFLLSDDLHVAMRSIMANQNPEFPRK